MTHAMSMLSGRPLLFKRGIPSNAAAAPFSAGCKHAARAQSSAESPRSRFNQGWSLHQVVHSQRKGVHLIIESAVRKLFKLRNPRLAPLSALKELDAAAMDHLDMTKKSCRLREAIRRNEINVERAELLLQITR
jgi:hypothetical protein